MNTQLCVLQFFFFQKMFPSKIEKRIIIEISTEAFSLAFSDRNSRNTHVLTREICNFCYTETEQNFSNNKRTVTTKIIL